VERLAWPRGALAGRVSRGDDATCSQRVGRGVARSWTQALTAGRPARQVGRQVSAACARLWTAARTPQCPVHRKKASPYSITERRVPQLIPVLGSQPAGDVNHKPDGRLPLFSARPAVTPRNP